MGSISSKVSKEGVDTLSDVGDTAAASLAKIYESANDAYNKVTGGGEVKKGVRKPVFTPAGAGMPEKPVELPELPTSAADLNADQLYETGTKTLDVKGGEAMAGQYFAAACDKGLGKSCMVVAEMFKHGVGCPANPKMAAKAYEHACAKGEGPGCYGLAEFFMQANHNLPRAAELLEASCGLKQAPSDQPACSALGAMWLSGQGKPQNLEQSARIFKRGCALQEPQACAKLGEMYLAGEGLGSCAPCAVLVLQAAQKHGFQGIDPVLAMAVQQAKSSSAEDQSKTLRDCLQGK